MDKQPDWWVAIFTGLLFIATFGLWIFTALLWWTTRKAVADGQKSEEAEMPRLKSLIGTRMNLPMPQRPWGTSRSL